MNAAFHLSATDPPHSARARAILKAYPEVRSLIGRNPWTVLIIVLVVGLQIAIAALMGSLGLGYWWAALVVAYVVGAFANHSMYVAIHDAVHNLIFANRTLNKLIAIVADLPNAVPGAMGFAVCHLSHHAHLGENEFDTDIANEWEARLVGNRWYMKALWLLLCPFFQATRIMRLRANAPTNRWILINIAAVLAFDVLVVVALGWNALLYLLASFTFSIGLHPLGARWIQEHHSFEGSQETFSYYGPINLVALNVGHHNEHHDFPSIPWNRLPQLRKMAPEFYDSLKSLPSLSKLLVRFIFDPRYSLYSRVVRETAPR